MYYRQIGNSFFCGDESHNYDYGSLKERIDGFIFVRESDNIQKPTRDIFDIIVEKMKKHNEIIDAMK